MKTMAVFLSELHRDIGAVAGEICIALTIFKVPGGVKALDRWADNLRQAAERIEHYSSELKKRQELIGR